MISLKLCRKTLISFFAVLVIISSTPTLPAYSQESEDSQIFISGFNAYQQKNYASTIDRMNEVLQKYPDTPLRDMVLFWLSRAYYKNGNLQDAAKFMSQFTREYPDNPLKGTVDEELLTLTARYEKGEQLPAGPSVVNSQLVAQKEQAEREKVRLAQEKADKDRQAAERATVEAAAVKARKEQAELERLAKLKAEEEQKVQASAAAAKQVAVEAEQRKMAAIRAEEDRRVAEQQRLAAVKADEERKAAEKTEQLKAESARLTALKKEQERLAQVKADEEKLALEKAASIKISEQQKLAAFKAEEERKATEKLSAEQQRQAAVEHEKLVSQQDELVRLALEKTEKKRLAAEKAEQERNAVEDAARAAKAEKKRLAALEAEKVRAEEARLAAIKFEEERKVAEKAERQRVESERLASERAAAVAAEAARLAEAQKDQERKAAEKAEAERVAQEKAALSKRAALEAEQQKLAQVKRDQERIAAELAEKERQASAAEAARLASIKPAGASPTVPVVVAVPVKSPEKTVDPGKAQSEKAALREKAIEQYKSILVSYPNSQAAASAANKLRELGVAVSQPVQAAVSQPVTVPVSENAQVLRFEVAQFAGLEFNLQPAAPAFNVAQRVSIPFSITNQGNGSDSFYLESGFPAEFASGFSSATAPAQAINQTTVLAPGETFKGLVHLTIPAASIDGLRISYPVKASSRTTVEATQSREVRLIAAAPLLRATVKADRTNPLPGEKIIYRIVLLNVGSTGAEDVSFRLNYPPQVEPVDFAASGFRQEMKAALVVDGLQLKSGESREFSLAFQLKEGTLAGQEILTRAELNNNQLKTSAAFVSTAAYVQPQHGLTVTPGSDRLIVIPGQTVSVPFVVTNTGNVREKFSVAPAVKGTQVVTIFHDLNRDGVRQANEPVITEVGPLAAKEEANVVMEIATPRTAADGSDDSAKISFRSSADALRSFEGVTRLVYSRPVLQMAMSGKDGRLKPGEVASFDLTITNRGSNLARVVELQSAWPEQLELVAADPAINSFSNGTLFWKFKELGAGEKRVIKVSLRVKPGTGVGTNIQVKNVLTYEDQIGNRY